MNKKSEVPKETEINHVSVGRVGLVNDYSYAFYNPHNARFYFEFKKWNFHPDMTLFKPCNSTELACNFMDCRIVVKKHLIEVVNKINTERRFIVDGSLNHRRDAVIRAVSILELECISVLKEFIKCFGGTSDCVCVKSHVPDNKILHDKIVDSIPDEVTFRNDVSKKVYKVSPKNVEVSTPEGASKTFRNLALFDFAPEIANELKSFNQNIVDLKEVTLLEIENKKLHMSVLFDIKDTLKDMREHIKASNVKSLKDEWW